MNIASKIEHSLDIITNFLLNRFLYACLSSICLELYEEFRIRNGKFYMFEWLNVIKYEKLYLTHLSYKANRVI